jgi:hypothetical protein
MLRRPITRGEAVGIAWLVPITTYVITQSYSPVQFRFLDEFFTLRTAQSILATHHLFHINPALVVSPQYPGIEIVTTAIASLSHLSIYVAGTIVVGVAHLLLGLGIYFLVMEVTRRRRLAALVVLLYSTGPHFQFFDSYFIYETMALPLAVACLLAVVKMLRAQSWGVGMGWGLVAAVAAAATVVTHHVTSYALVGFLLALAFGLTLRRRKTGWSWRVLPLICITAGVIVVWNIGIATATIAYFAPAIKSLIPSFGHHVTRRSAPLPVGPAFDLALEYVSVLLLALLGAIGVWRIWRARPRWRWDIAFALSVASIGFVAALGARVLGANGSELYGRSSTFFMLPMGLAAAVAISSSRAPRALGSHLYGWVSGSQRSNWIGIIAIVLLGVGGVAGGWPAYYARLPGSFRVEGWERAVDEHNLELALWAAKELPPNYGVASDFMTANLLSSLGHLSAPANVAPLFLNSKFSPSVRKLVREEGIDFIVVDNRMSKQLPADGLYFEIDPRAGEYHRPLPAIDLEKFNNVPGVSRIFEDGTMTVYALTGSLYTTSRSGDS